MQEPMLLLEQKALHAMVNTRFIFNAPGSIQNYILKNKATKRTHTCILGMNLTLKRLIPIGKKLKVITSITNSPLHPDSQNPGTKVTIVVPFAFDYSEFQTG